MSSKDYEHRNCFICNDPTTSKPNAGTADNQRSRAFSHDASNAREVEDWFQKNQGYKFKSFRTHDRTYGWSIPVCASCYLRVSRESMNNPPVSPMSSSATVKALADYLAGISRRYNSTEQEALQILISDTSNHLASGLPDVMGSDQATLQFYISDFVEFIKNTKAVYPDWVIKWIIPVHLIWVNDMNEIIPDKLKNISSFAELGKMLVPAILDRFSNESMKAADKAREDIDTESDESYNKEGYNRINLLKDINMEEYFLSARLVDFLLHGLRRENSVSSDEFSDQEQLLNALLVCIEGFERLQGNFIGTLGIFEARPWAIDCLLQLGIDQVSNFGPTCFRILETLAEATRVFNLPNLRKSIDESFDGKRLNKIAVIIGNLSGQHLKVFEFVIPLVNLVCFVRQTDRSPEMILFLRSSLNVVHDSLPEYINFPSHDKPAIRSEIISAAPNTICSKVENMFSAIESMRGDIEYSIVEEIRRIRTRFAHIEKSRQETLLEINPPNSLHLEECTFFSNPEEETEFDNVIKRLEGHSLLNEWRPKFSKHVSTWQTDSLIQLESSHNSIQDMVMEMSTDDINKLVGDLIADCKDVRTKNPPNHFLMEATANIERTFRSFPEIDPDYIKYVPQAIETNTALTRKNLPYKNTTKDVRSSELLRPSSEPLRPRILWNTSDPHHPINRYPPRAERNPARTAPPTPPTTEYRSEVREEEHIAETESEKSPTEGKNIFKNFFGKFIGS